MEGSTDRGAEMLKDSLTLHWLPQVYAHVLPVSQLHTIVLCLQVAQKIFRKLFVVVFLG